MRKYGRTDGNMVKLVKELRQMGASVAVTSFLGGGFPDLVVGWRGNNYLFEVKDPAQKPSARRLTPDEKEFHKLWKGQIAVIEKLEDFKSGE